MKKWEDSGMMQISYIKKNKKFLNNIIVTSQP
jgi:hypothetical protein